MIVAPALAAAVIAMAPSLASQRAADPAAQMAGCPGLDVCLRILGKSVPPTDTGVLLYLPNRDVAAEIAANLNRFGPAAKQELLRRAVGGHGGWRNVASQILARWPELSAQDVPALVQALRLAPGSTIADALARIGTPEAIQALADDLRNSDAANGSPAAWALANLGETAAPYLLRALEDPQSAEGVMTVLRDMPPGSAAALAPMLVDRSLGHDRPDQNRVAALRALEIIGASARLDLSQIRPLVLEGSAAVRQQAFDTLAAARDPSVRDRVVARCRPTVWRRTYVRVKLWPSACLPGVVAYGSAALPAAEPLLDFLDAPLGDDRAAGATAVGMIGFKRATPVLIGLLSDSDWRVVFASIRSLGWFDAVEAGPALRDVADRHWLPEVRAEATRTLLAISGPHSAPTAPDPSSARELLTIDALPDAPACPSEHWSWKGADFGLPVRVDDQTKQSISFPGGRLQGTNFGEFRGSLTWIVKDGPSRGDVVVDDNVHAIEKTHDGALAVIGFAHMSSNYGYLVRLDPQPGYTPAWTATTIGALPAVPEAVARIDDDTFVAWSAGRPVVFTPQAILGIAACRA